MVVSTRRSTAAAAAATVAAADASRDLCKQNKMGTSVESAYIERLREDIDIACRRLEEQGIESMVVTVGQDSHRVSGSLRGKSFLEDRYIFIAEFVQYCKDTRPAFKKENETLTLFNEQGNSVELQSIEIYTGEPVNIESLSTPAVPDGGATKTFDDDTDEYDDTQLFSTNVLEELETAKAMIKPQLDTDQTQKSNKKETTDVDELDKSEKENTTTPRRSLRRAKKDQANNIVENLPHVKVVLTKMKDKKAEKQTSKWSSHKPLKNSVSTNDKDDKTDKNTCGVCKHVADTLEQLNSHMASHKALACHMCKKVFRTKDSLDEHRQKHIDRGEYHECQQCDNVFKFPWQLGEHVEKIHEKSAENVDGSFPCGRCGYVFKRESHLSEHNQRYLDCQSDQTGVTAKQNQDNALQSMINFIDPILAVAKTKTVKELLEYTSLPAACQICTKTFDKAYNFKRHILHHSEAKPFKCVICTQQFQMEENHKKHLKLHDLRPYYCVNCYMRFETKVRLDHHFRFTCKKSSEKPDLTCDVCGHQSQNLSALAAHKRVHSGVKQWACDICGKTLSSRDSLSRHKIVFHQEERPHACKECGRTFKIKDTLKKHLKTHGERKYKCEICGKACVESGNLKKHMMTHTKEKPYICETCGKAYGRRSLLDNHRRLHTGEKPYHCDVKGCDKTFRSYGNLKQHKATHTEEHSFICDICGRTFKVKSRLNHHRKNHTIDWRWPCAYCEQKYKSIFMYKNHLAKCHPEKKADIEERTNIRLYECHICQKMYGDKEDLTRHIYIHKGLRPFKCQYCGKSFNDKSNMKCHERIHTGEKKLNCSMCFKSFIQPRALRVHMKNVHNQGEMDMEMKLEESLIDKHEEYTEQECKTAVENVLQDDHQELTELQPAQQAVVAQAYPVNPGSHSIHLFPNLVREFEPLMIVENY